MAGYAPSHNMIPDILHQICSEPEHVKGSEFAVGTGKFKMMNSRFTVGYTVKMCRKLELSLTKYTLCKCDHESDSEMQKDAQDFIGKNVCSERLFQWTSEFSYSIAQWAIKKKKGTNFCRPARYVAEFWVLWLAAHVGKGDGRSIYTNLHCFDRELCD